MANNKYSWNKTLKFSWGHIIAFVALIIISYVVYMGAFYRNGGSFINAGITVGIIDILLLITFIGAQQVKATDKKFDRSIVIERILVCISPIALIIALFFCNHFWSVFDKRDEIVNKFNISIAGAKNMFYEYDSYANNRIKTYDANLVSIISQKEKGNTTLFGQAGFRDDVSLAIQKRNFVHTLELQLLSYNTDSLKNVATKWIDESNQGASIWNAFLVGNVAEISSAIKVWHKTLREFSEPKLTNEEIMGNSVFVFDAEQKSIKNATEGIDSLAEIYKNSAGLKFNTIWFGLLMSGMLIFPYLLQKRNTRAEGLYFLLPEKYGKILTKGSSSTNNNNTKREQNNVNESNVSSSNDDDIYGGTF